MDDRAESVELSLDALTPPGLDDHSYRLRLRHTHLPKLADYDFVEYDAERALIRQGSRFDEIRPVIETLFENRTHLPGEYP
jgi:hypothetical protein